MGSNNFQYSYGEDFERKLKVFFSGSNTPNVRRSGRTTLLAKIFVELAIESEEDLYVFDHFEIFQSGFQVKDHLMRMIDGYIKYLRDNGINIGVRKFDRRKGIISLFSDYQYLEFYQNQRIPELSIFWNVNKTPFPIETIEERIKFLKNRKLLLIC